MFCPLTVRLSVKTRHN